MGVEIKNCGQKGGGGWRRGRRGGIGEGGNREKTGWSKRARRKGKKEV